MKIKFEKLVTTSGKVYVDFGDGFQEYDVATVKDNGIQVPETCADYSKIQIKGSSAVLKNLDIISNVKVSDENAIPLENVTGARINYFPGFKETLRKYPNLTDIIVDDPTIGMINSYAFFSCSQLKNISIESRIEIIREFAFSECENLISIALPDTVTSIYSNAFLGCESLKNINLPNNVCRLDEGAFSKCRKLMNISIPDRVTEIGRSAFEECNALTNVTLPSGLEIIGPDAFYSCNPSMIINFKGSEEQWNNIEKRGTSAGLGIDNYTINYNYTGE